MKRQDPDPEVNYPVILLEGAIAYLPVGAGGGFNYTALVSKQVANEDGSGTSLVIIAAKSLIFLGEGRYLTDWTFCHFVSRFAIAGIFIGSSCKKLPMALMSESRYPVRTR